MTTAVAQVLKDGERVLTDGFTRFMLHYRFQADFCNPASGNEKGNVENRLVTAAAMRLSRSQSLPRLRNLMNSSWSGAKKDADRLHYKHKVPIRELWEEDKAAL